MEIIELKQSPTTIWVKKGTKMMLEKRSLKRESYDEVIRRLMRAEDALTRLMLDGATGAIQEKEAKNKLKISEPKIGSSRLSLSKGESIVFIYNIPQHPIDKEFQFRISYTKIIYQDKEIKPQEKYKEGILMAEDYLKIVEMIIKDNIDPLFRIEQKHIMDPDWWRRKFESLGLNSYREDIEEELIKFGVIP